MKRLIFKKEDLSKLPIPEVGYKTLGIDLDGNLNYIDDLGDIIPISGTSLSNLSTDKIWVGDVNGQPQEVNDVTFVDNAGAVMNTDTTTSAMSFVIDEDNMSSNSATKVPTQQSVKAYVDSLVVSSVTYQGGYDASTTSPNGSATKGDMYTVTVAGTGGGYWSTSLEIGDVIISEIDNPTTETDWTVVNKDLDAASIKTSYESNANTNAFTDAEKSKLSGIEPNADVTDATNVDAAGAVMNTDTTTSAMSFVIDEDNMISNSDTKVPTQQSVKSYVDAQLGGSSGLVTTTLSGATILSTTYDVVLCGGGTSYTVTLPAALANPDKSYYIKNINPNGDDIIIDGAGYNIDGSPTFRLDPYNHSVRIISDGTHWRVLNEFGNLSKDTSFTQINRDGTIFTWNDVTNPTTGRTWMDRNLGATQFATSSTDALAYGDLYQWGRLKDGHESRTSAVTTVLSKDNSPLHGDFITVNSGVNDWRSIQNDNLWQGLNGENNICPPGYRLPTEAEWQDEIATWSSLNDIGAMTSVLKLPMGGRRFNSNGSLGNVGNGGNYWSSSVSGTSARSFYFTTSQAAMFPSLRSRGIAIRLIKD